MNGVYWRNVDATQAKEMYYELTYDSQPFSSDLLPESFGSVVQHRNCSYRAVYISIPRDLGQAIKALNVSILDSGRNRVFDICDEFAISCRRK